MPRGWRHGGRGRGVEGVIGNKGAGGEGLEVVLLGTHRKEGIQLKALHFDLSWPM